LFAIIGLNSMPTKQCGQQMTRTVSGDEELFISMTEMRTARAMPDADSRLFDRKLSVRALLLEKRRRYIGSLAEQSAELEARRWRLARKASAHLESSRNRAALMNLTSWVQVDSSKWEMIVKNTSYAAVGSIRFMWSRCAD
jgi:hypothetical protein